MATSTVIFVYLTLLIYALWTISTLVKHLTTGERYYAGAVRPLLSLMAAWSLTVVAVRDWSDFNIADVVTSLLISTFFIVIAISGRLNDIADCLPKGRVTLPIIILLTFVVTVAICYRYLVSCY